MKEIQDFLNTVYLGNTYREYIIFVSIILAGLLFHRLLAKLTGKIIFHSIRRKSRGVDVTRFHDTIKRPVRLLILLIFIYIASDFITFPDEWHLDPSDSFGLKMIISRSFSCLFIGVVLWLGVQAVNFLGIVLKEKIDEEKEPMNEQLVSFGTDIVKILIIILGIFFMLAMVFHINVGTLVAGLGIGGLAVALATKETLENLLGSFTIFMDKPFVIGDMIEINDVAGNVEKVGFRSTRIRTMDKKYVTIPNKLVVDNPLINYTQRSQQRTSFHLFLDKTTTSNQLKKFISEYKTFIDAIPETTQDSQVWFSEIENNAFKISVVYFVNTMDIDVFMNIREGINMKAFELATSIGLTFNFPQILMNKS